MLHEQSLQKHLPFHITYDQVEPGDDDSFTMIGYGVWGKAGFGPVTLQAEVNYSENVGHPATSATTYNVGSIWGGPRSYDVDGDGDMDKIADTETLSFWVTAGFNFGPATLLLGFGVDDTENPGDPSDPYCTREVTRKGYGVALPISVAKGFTVKPEITHYDFDSGALDGSNNPLTVDYGSDTIVGVQFMLVF